MKPLIHIGEVKVVVGDPPNNNPYSGMGLIGIERRRALSVFKSGCVSANYTFWYAPAAGGARLIASDEVDWESSGVE